MRGWPWLKLYRVEGRSMLPTFGEGTLLLGSALITPRPGHVVVLRHEPLSVKRVAHASDSGFWVEGDNPPASTDSRSFGYVQRKDIEAVIFMPFLLKQE